MGSLKTNESDPLFCDVVQKINRTDCKSQDLVVVLIDSHLLLLYADSLKLKSKMEIKDITGRIFRVTWYTKSAQTDSLYHILYRVYRLYSMVHM